MLIYILIVLCLSLAGVAGLQMMYMMYIDRLDKERKKRIHEVELRCKILISQLEAAELQIEEKNRILESLGVEIETEEVWADVIEDR